MYFMEFKVEIYEILICYAVKAILGIYSIVIYVNLVIFFKNICHRHENGFGNETSTLCTFG